MAGEVHLGLTGQTIGATPFRSDRISVGPRGFGATRPYTSDR